MCVFVYTFQFQDRDHISVLKTIAIIVENHAGTVVHRMKEPSVDTLELVNKSNNFLCQNT